MSANEMETRVKELREMRRMVEELEAEIEALQDSIKAEMDARNTEEVTGSDWRITWKPVISARFDSKAFKATHAELYRQYTKETTSRRFVVA